MAKAKSTTKGAKGKKTVAKKRPTQAKHKTPGADADPLKKILVVGDLFIDENWLMAKSDNYHSTDVGQRHYTSRLEKSNSQILSVCGIASVLKILDGDYAYDGTQRCGQYLTSRRCRLWSSYTPPATLILLM